MNRLRRLIRVATKSSRRVIGLMSGTSLDAIDAAMVRITGHGTEAKVKLEHFSSYPFPPKIRSAVRDLFDPRRARVDQICRYDFIIGELFAAAVNKMLQETGVDRDRVGNPFTMKLPAPSSLTPKSTGSTGRSKRDRPSPSASQP